jgi:hypothetical protein
VGYGVGGVTVGVGVAVGPLGGVGVGVGVGPLGGVGVGVGVGPACLGVGVGVGPVCLGVAVGAITTGAAVGGSWSTAEVACAVAARVSWVAIAA